MQPRDVLSQRSNFANNIHEDISHVAASLGAGFQNSGRQPQAMASLQTCTKSSSRPGGTNTSLLGTSSGT